MLYHITKNIISLLVVDALRDAAYVIDFSRMRSVRLAKETSKYKYIVLWCYHRLVVHWLELCGVLYIFMHSFT